MPPLQLLIKPASGMCNMECSYCFYKDTMGKRQTSSYGMMNLNTLENLVEKALNHADGGCGFMFQGGEPTLAGLEFFQELIRLQHKYNHKNIQIHNSIQTNGYALDEKWCVFLKEHDFLVGLSLDGIKPTHDAYRKSQNGKDTFIKIIETAKRLDKFGVEYNILTVVNSRTALRAKKIYDYYKKQGFRYQQYIACLDPLFDDRQQETYSLSPEAYGNFLKELFDLWYMDLQKGQQPYIRLFENYINILMGNQPESCEQRGVCSVQNVIEADGSVYPCDFYVLDEYRLGNINADDFINIAQKAKEMNFVESSINHDQKCRNCKYLPLCRGGCTRQRVESEDGSGSRNYFCQSYEDFFNYTIERMERVSKMINI